MNPVIIGNATLYLADCLDVLPTLPKVDAVITDPPYGIGMDGGNIGYKGFNDFARLGWDVAPPDAALISLTIAAGSKAVIWGGNYFQLPPSRCWFIWDKGAGFKGRTYAEAELAWTSLDANTRVFLHDPLARGDYKGKSHPTMKPEALMRWCINEAGSPSTIIDPFCGSGSTGVAAMQLGKKFIGIEREQEYFDTACIRIENAQRQSVLFEPPSPKPEQASLIEK